MLVGMNKDKVMLELGLLNLVSNGLLIFCRGYKSDEFKKHIPSESCRPIEETY